MGQMTPWGMGFVADNFHKNRFNTEKVIRGKKVVLKLCLAKLGL
jgi:hypothetical protein